VPATFGTPAALDAGLACGVQPVLDEPPKPTT
jgi:hypothetical protein